MNKKIVSLILLVCLMFSVVSVQVSANTQQDILQNEISKSLTPQKDLPQIDLKNAKILSTKTYTQKETDKDGVEWTDTITEYKVYVLLRKHSNEKQVANSSTLDAETPYIDPSVQSVVGTNSGRTYVRYYGRCYTTMPVSTNMTMALLWWAGTTYLVEAAQPTYISYGTAVGTPIYVFTSPSTGYWKSRNSFICTEEGYTPATGTAYSGDLYIEPY